MQPKKFITGLVVVILVAGLFQYFRPLPAVAPVGLTPAAPKTSAIALPWPAAGQASLGAEGYGVLESHRAASPQSTASIAKIITALAVLQKKPLTASSQGPIITLDQSDVGYFNYYYSQGGSVAQVNAGEQISEYQLMQGMLIPSANNMADSLARWAFGSTQAYVIYANQMVKGLGLSHTTVNNTNGFDDTTTSTADDLVRLGLEAIKNPIIANIVGQKSASLPVAGQVNNVNWLLGNDGVVGIKTGNTDKAGGCYLFAANRLIAGQTMTIVGAVLGANSLADAITAGRNLILGADSGFEKLTAIHQGQVLGSYHAPWGASSQLKAARDLSLVVWKGKDVEISSNLASAPATAQSGSSFGSVKVAASGQSASSPLYLSNKLSSPSLWWRLTRI